MKTKEEGDDIWASVLTMCSVLLGYFGLSVSSDWVLRVRDLRETARQKTSCLFMSWSQKSHTVPSTTISLSKQSQSPAQVQGKADRLCLRCGVTRFWKSMWERKYCRGQFWKIRSTAEVLGDRRMGDKLPAVLEGEDIPEKLSV